MRALLENSGVRRVRSRLARLYRLLSGAPARPQPLVQETQPPLVQKTQTPPVQAAQKPKGKPGGRKKVLRVRKIAQPSSGLNELAGPVPHYGRKLLAMVEAVRQTPTPPLYKPEYDDIKDEFDVAYYLTRYPELARNELDPVAHYIRTGASEGRDPSPYFSTTRYITRYPDVASSGMTAFGHWITSGRASDRICLPYEEFETASEMIGRPPDETQRIFLDRYKDVRSRLEHGTLGEMVARAAEIDPLISLSWPDALAVRVTPFGAAHNVSRTVALYSLQKDAGFRRAKAVIVVNRPRWGGARRMEGHIARALAARFREDEVLIIASDQGGDMPPGKFPAGSRYIDFPASAGSLNPSTRQQVLMEFLRSLRPEYIFNVNSRLMWETLSTYGPALADVSKIVGCFFCNEQTQFGYWTGYPLRRFYRHFDTLSAVCTDSRFLADELRETYQVPPSQRDKLHVLAAPVDAAHAVATAPAVGSGRRPQVFWSGRFDHQKRLDVVYAIARAMPGVDFRMWGESVMSGIGLLPPAPANVKHEGVYARFADLPLHDADLWLYTSEWDGVPSVLLEVSMTGVPIVGSRVGGTGEVLRDDLSWPIDAFDDSEAYRAAIEDVLSDPQAARERAARLRDAMVRERTTATYEEAVGKVLDQCAGAAA